MATLILLRHGQSTWNQENLFTGWWDVDLTERGRAEAARGGELLAEAGLLPDVVHTSVLVRAIRTAELALEACGRSWIPVRRSWRLNERHYGALQGKDKKQIAEQHGPEQLHEWRRSYDVPPPPIEAGSEFPCAATSVTRPATRSGAMASNQYGSMRSTTSARHSERGTSSGGRCA
jgi:2,3-bisphosphoglycerate-dependent phosphoglycerate mutase